MTLHPTAKEFLTEFTKDIIKDPMARQEKIERWVERLSEREEAVRQEVRPKVNNSAYVSLILDGKEYSTMTGIGLLSNKGIEDAYIQLTGQLVAELVEKRILV